MKSIKKTHVLIVLSCLVCFGIGYFIPKQNFIQSGESSVEQDKFNTVYNILTNKWYYSNSNENLSTELIEQALIGMTTLEEDPHTSYLDLESAQQFSSALDGSSVGLGFNIYVNADNNLVVKNVYINSAADQAGLQPGDVITAVDDRVCSSNNYEDVIAYIQENEGNELTITYQRDGQEATVNVTPGTFDTTVSVRIYDDYAKVIVSSFSEDTGKDFYDALQRVKENDIDQLIIDLRDNTGGYLTAAIEVASALLPDDTIVFKEEYADGSQNEQKTDDDYTQQSFDQIVILQNENTASASEVVIGALKEHLNKKVTTVGTTTYGKGTEQTQISFEDGTSMKYTIAKWLTPSGESIDGTGFEADVEVDVDDIRSMAYVEFNEDDVIEADTVAENAAAVQSMLQYLGYDIDRTDTYFSVQSSEALKQFQSENDLEATGNCDYETWNALLDQSSLQLNEEGEQGDNQLQRAIELLK